MTKRAQLIHLGFLTYALIVIIVLALLLLVAPQIGNPLLDSITRVLGSFSKALGGH